MTRRRAAVIGGFAAAALAIFVLTAIVVLYVLQSDRVLPNTTLAGHDVGGMTSDELTLTVGQLASQRQHEPVIMTFEDQRFTLAPDEVDYRVDVDATVENVFGRGRGRGPAGLPERVRSLRATHEFDVVESWNDQAVVSWVDDVARRVDRRMFHGEIEIDPDTLAVQVEPPYGSARVRRDDAADLVAEALTRPGPDEFELPVDAEPALVDADDLLDVAAQAERAVEAPVELIGDDATLTLEPRDLAQLITVERVRSGDRHEVALAVTAGRVIVVVDADTMQQFAADPLDARYSIGREPPVTFDDQGSTSFEPVEVAIGVEPGRSGTRFDPQLVAEQLTGMLRDGVRGARIRLETIEPDVPTEIATQLRPTHLLGTFTTYYQAGQARVQNIQRLADEVDGAIVLPDEQFSINGISGRRTCEGGYVPAGTIVRGELVDTCGGGTSQFGTTTYNAAFFAGVQIDQWKAHSWYISRYPMGREATLNYPELDVKFTNNTGGVILVKTSHTPTSVTVSVYGRPIAQRVTATLGSPRNPRSPSTEVRRTSDLYEGQERVIQSAGSQGFSVRVVRTIELLDGREITEDIDTVYVPQNRIVERGTRPRPD